MSYERKWLEDLVPGGRGPADSFRRGRPFAAAAGRHGHGDPVGLASHRHWPDRLGHDMAGPPCARLLVVVVIRIGCAGDRRHDVFLAAGRDDVAFRRAWPFDAAGWQPLDRFGA